MKPMQATATLTALLLAAWATGVQAAPPLSTDEADVLDPSACRWSYELQTGTNSIKRARGWATQAGCGIGVNTQVNAGFARTVAAGVRDDAVSFDGKTALVKRAGDGVGVALAYGWVGAREGGNELRTLSTNIGFLFSQSFGPKWTGHANAGWINTRGTDRAATWGLAAEYALTDSLDWVVETFGESGTKSWASTGLRWAASEKISVFGSHAIQRDTPRLVVTTLGIQLGF